MACNNVCVCVVVLASAAVMIQAMMMTMTAGNSAATGNPANDTIEGRTLAMPTTCSSRYSDGD